MRPALGVDPNLYCEHASEDAQVEKLTGVAHDVSDGGSRHIAESAGLLLRGFFPFCLTQASRILPVFRLRTWLLLLRT